MIDHHVFGMLREVKEYCDAYKREFKRCNGCKYSFINRKDNCVDCTLSYPEIWEIKELEKKGVIK